MRTIDLFSLGELFVSDFLKEGEEPRGGKHDLKLVMEIDTGAVRLATTAPLDTMFGKYFYRSGINETMVKELKNVVDSILPLIKLKENDIWADLASNDGTLLSFVPKNLIRIGVDPAEDSFKHEAEKHSDLIIQDFFTADNFKKSKFGNQKCKVVTCIAMFYASSTPDKFLQDIYEILDDEGLLVMQLSHSGLMIEQCAFDNILSEHVYYYTLGTLEMYLSRAKLSVVDVQLNDVNGGSFRVYVRKNSANPKLFATQPYRDICRWRVNSLWQHERKKSLDSSGPWIKFYQNIQTLKKQTVDFITQAKAEGKTVWGYGASTKGNTLLQAFGLDHTMITAIAERSTFKWGLKTVGTNIPIVSEDEMRKAKPDYLLILPWHFVANFIEREKELLETGTKFIVPCPKFEIIEK